MNVHDALESIGLSKKESDVYLALLQTGRASAYLISQKSGLKKPTTYVILDELLKKGLVYRIPGEKKHLYTARSPEEMFILAEQDLIMRQKKITDAKRVLPELRAFTKGKETKVSMLYFEGVSGIKQMLEYGEEEMREKEMVGFYAVHPEMHKGLAEYFQYDWGEYLLGLGVTTRGIVPDHPPSLTSFRKVDAKYNRRIRIIPYDKYSSEISFDVIGNMTRIQDYKNLQGVLLENPDVAKTVREIFELVWNAYD